ncbi:hypothetical protein MSAN_01128300 [Mycena sanguinolenta]|uniref:Uncharacterized protein n=1 Tax=Mycena sanguinolenta TaxID=230812 RepID=A0A8H6YMJ9_9AGAR|nr:hypothetical protein MSAN_01128300 [Mycena sanguinolenta]
MLALRRLFTLALISVACASKLQVRASQTLTPRSIPSSTKSTRPRAKPPPLSVPTLMADHQLNTATLGTQMTTLDNTFKQMDTSLAATPVSSGSTTVSPTNDEIGVTLSDAIQLVASGLSGIIATGAVPGFPTMVANLDPIMSAALAQYNITLPGQLSLVHTMMLDAQQFLVDEGFTKTLATLGF